MTRTERQSNSHFTVQACPPSAHPSPVQPGLLVGPAIEPGNRGVRASCSAHLQHASVSGAVSWPRHRSWRRLSTQSPGRSGNELCARSLRPRCLVAGGCLQLRGPGPHCPPRAISDRGPQFETGLEGSTVDNPGVWEVGVPTYGPLPTHWGGVRMGGRTVRGRFWGGTTGTTATAV